MLLLWVLLVFSSSLVAAHPLGPVNETPYSRKYFYVGGRYADDGKGEHVFKDQMYVEQLTPIGISIRSHPIVFIHGQAQTGTVCRLFSNYTEMMTCALVDLSPTDVLTRIGSTSLMGVPDGRPTSFPRVMSATFWIRQAVAGVHGSQEVVS